MGRGRVYPRGSTLWLDYTDETGRRRRQSTGLRVGQEKEAEGVLRALLRRLEDAGPEAGTVRAWAERWIERRRARGLPSADEDARRLRRYILPEFGGMRLEDVRLRDVRDLVDSLLRRPSRKGGTLAPRTVRLIYGTLQTMMADAVGDEMIPVSPCQLRPSQLPPVRDKDPEWRAKAIFSRAELEVLISHPEIPEDRRLVYALLGLTGLRWGEMAALRWRAYDRTVEPLGRLTVATSYDTTTGEVRGTKTGATRLVPVHPVLASMLAAWRLRGGREAGPDELIIPPAGRSRAEHRSVAQGLRQLRADLQMLGWRPRRIHDLRRTFASLAQDDGAPRDVVRIITHTPPTSDVLELYTTRQWSTLCRAVSGIQVGLREGEVVELRAAAGAEAGGTPGAQRDPGHEKAPQDRDLAGHKVAGDTGFEPVARRSDQMGQGAVSAGKHGGKLVMANFTEAMKSVNPGHKCAPCAPSDPEARIRAAVEGLEPAAARALLLRILSELG